MVKKKKFLGIILISLTMLSALAGCGNDPTLSSWDGTAIGGGRVTLAWDAPTTNIDGTPLTDLAGYKIYYGTSSGYYTKSADVGNFTGAVISNLSQGTWYFTVTAYDSSGNESTRSNEVSREIIL